MLYFVATPIGNLKDMSFRAVEVLNSVDVIACEDTRNSLKLLNYYNIKKKLISYHKFNEGQSGDAIINMLKDNKKVAVISDAGMPVISDPGNNLIQKLKKERLPYTIIPGANAGLCALILSGLNSERFTFVGFLPDDNKKFKDVMAEIKGYQTTLIFYIAPHDVVKITKKLSEFLGNRRAVLVNEITKIYEKTYDFYLGDELSFEPKGEYVLVVEGDKATGVNELNDMSIEEHVQYYLSLGEAKADVIKRVAKERGVSKNEVYQVAIKL